MKVIQIIFTLLICFYCDLLACKVSFKKVYPCEPDFPNAVKCKYYVDKSLLLKEFLEDEHTKAYVTAPRNFGKSLNLHMLKYFLEIQVHSNGSEIMNKADTTNFQLFTNLKIYKEHPEFFKRHFGRYPVILIDYGPLAEVVSYEKMLEGMRCVLWDTFKQHIYLMDVEKLWVKDLELVDFKKYVVSGLNENLSEYAIRMSLQFLIKVLYRHFGRKPIVLIDEYDSYVNSILFENNQAADKTINLFKVIHRPLIKKTEKIIQNFFCTGILHITGSGLSPVDRDLKDYSFLDDHRYSKYYGVTEDELTTLLKEYTEDKVETKILKTDIHQFYDGYTVLGRETHVYNILSVIEYLQNKKNGMLKPLKSYWARPKFFNSLLPLFYSQDVKYDIKSLLENKHITLETYVCLSKEHVMALKSIIDQKCDVSVDHRNIFFNFLLQMGYLTFRNVRTFYQNINTPNRIIEIPNLEIKQEIRRMLYLSVIMQYTFNSNTIGRINKNIDDISELKCSETEFTTIFNDLTTFIMQSKYIPTTENDFQCDLFALLNPAFNLATETAKKVDNRIIRLDIQFINTNNVSFIIETKVLKSKTGIEEKAMQKCTEGAINQIIEKRYILILEENRRNRVVCLGICLGVTKFKNGSTEKLVGLGYSKYLNPGDILNSTRIFVQKRDEIE